MTRPRTGIQPGSFDPPTAAHLAIAEAARRQRDLDRVVWAVSRRPLGKEAGGRTALGDRLAVLEAVADAYPWLAIEVTDLVLIADLAAGLDVVVMGADKWHQVHDPAFYGGDPAARDAAVARLPEVAVAPRPPFTVPDGLALDLPAWIGDQSSPRAV